MWRTFLIGLVLLAALVVLVESNSMQFSRAQSNNAQSSSAKWSRTQLHDVERRERAMQFHLRAQQRTGLLIPMYLYPDNIHTNASYNRLIALKQKYPTVPMWVIINPASGPGSQVDLNYAKAIHRLQGAGCVVLGYVSTQYGKKEAGKVQADIDQWQKLYPRIQGLFFDEMIYEDTEKGIQHQLALHRYAKSKGCWPIVGNPGAPTPERYFKHHAADVIVVHETGKKPTETNLRGDYFGGYSDYPPFTRAVLVHSQNQLDKKSLQMIGKYSRWIYITDDKLIPGNPKEANPWDSLSQHLEEICQELSRN